MRSQFMQAFPRVSLEQRFFGRKIEAFLARFLVKPLLAFPENLCSEMPSLRLSESSAYMIMVAAFRVKESCLMLSSTHCVPAQVAVPYEYAH
jgi:hypothetical protein